MKVSVIIPVYNAGKYVEEAVESALKQKEVEEIILIEDGSPDNSLEVCKKLEKKYKKVKLFRHSRGENKGAGETRNVGLKNAKSEFVAFLDADDFYLENRFKIAKKVFKNSKADGVYEAIGVHFEDKEEEKKWYIRSGKKLTTVIKKVNPDNLFLFLVLAGSGHFSLDGLTIKKEILDKELGLFNKNLKISQDTHFCLKLALIKNLYPGDIKKPVAMRRVHKENRITKINTNKMIYYQNILWTSFLKWSKNKDINFSEKSLIYFMQYRYSKLVKIAENSSSILKLNFYSLLLLVFFSLRHPLKGCYVFNNIIYYILKRFV